MNTNKDEMLRRFVVCVGNKLTNIGLNIKQKLDEMYKMHVKSTEYGQNRIMIEGMDQEDEEILIDKEQIEGIIGAKT